MISYVSKSRSRHASAALALLILIASLSWRRSFVNSDGYVFARAGKVWIIESRRGRILLSNRPTVEMSDALSELRAKECRQLTQRLRWDINVREIAATSHQHTLDAELEPRAKSELQGVGRDRDAVNSRLRTLALARSSSALTEYSVRYWVLIALCSIAFVGKRLVSINRRLRLRRGLCPVCKYDLCATPDGCPECGWGRGKEHRPTVGVQF